MYLIFSLSSGLKNLENVKEALGLLHEQRNDEPERLFSAEVNN